ncbi:uncharacterized protein FIESC28_05350 [Fusarium coffeatum]|uniref:Uncharacterized protein n=1 Tax=Fusarium coffeatum TaxID=231269 RepID=A0A366RSK4_9HYPO|nr:uncharacterized protein FIESC28_05350 [Fusarium coffeatum]RBR20071.1 hypothetical protein FIESC28_05350 [Fusarium coffeatum]
MALDPVKHNHKKAQDNLVAHTGAWTQAASFSPPKSIVKVEERAEDSKTKAEKKD